MSYISELQIDNGAIVPVGSSLYGICDTAVGTYAKVVTLANFDTLIKGVTVHVKFTNGNSAPLTNPSDSTQHLTLKVGSTSAQQISNPGGNINWSSGAVISFTLDGDTEPYNWIVNDSDSGAEITIEQTYSSSSTNAISGAGVASALGTLGAASAKAVDSSIADSGVSANASSTNLPTTAAVVSYVQGKTAGLTGAMHFIGVSTTAVTDGGTEVPTISGHNFTNDPLQAGDVILYRNSSNVIGQEYVWTGSAWELLGDEGSYLLASQVENTSVINGITWSAGTLPVVTLDNSATSVLTGISNSGTARAASAEVTSGVLKITTGILPTFGTGSVTGVTSVTAGTAPSLTSTTESVLKRTT